MKPHKFLVIVIAPLLLAPMHTLRAETPASTSADSADSHLRGYIAIGGGLAGAAIFRAFLQDAAPRHASASLNPLVPFSPLAPREPSGQSGPDTLPMGPASTAPEPNTVALVATGLAGVAPLARRRKR